MPMPAGAGAGPDPAASSLYVGGLDPRVCTELLHDVFSIAGKVTLCRVVSDKHTGASMGFGFVDYPDHQTAVRAQQLLNGRALYGHDLTVDWAHANSNAAAGRAHAHAAAAGAALGAATARGTAAAAALRTSSNNNNTVPTPAAADGLVNGVDISNHYCLFIGNLDASVTDADLLAAFSVFGECSSAHVSRDSASNSRRCAFVSFKDRAPAQAAIDGLNGQVIANRPMRVDWARTKTNAVTRAAAMGLPDVDLIAPRHGGAAAGAPSGPTNGRHEHQHTGPHHPAAQRPLLDFTTIVGQTSSAVTTAYVSNLPPTIDDPTLRTAFDKHGIITDVRIPESSRSTGGDKIYAFVVYADHESAARAIYDSQGGIVVAGRSVSVQWGRESNRGAMSGNSGPLGGRRYPSGPGQRLPHAHHNMNPLAYVSPHPPGYMLPHQSQFSAPQHQGHHSYSASVAGTPSPGNGVSQLRSPAFGLPQDAGQFGDSARHRQQRPAY